MILLGSHLSKANMANPDLVELCTIASILSKTLAKTTELIIAIERIPLLKIANLLLPSTQHSS